MELTRRIIADAKLQAEVRAAQDGSSMLAQLDAEARRLGFRTWSRLINKFRKDHK